MPYAFRRQTPGRSYPVLVEVTAAELAAHPALYQRCSGHAAHLWVKQYGVHETGLYLGEDSHGRPCVRYAKATD